MTNVTFTVFTKTSGGPLTKTIRPDGNGGIIKDSSQCYLDAGTAERITIPFAEFGGFLRSLRPDQAIGHGVSQHNKVRVISERQFTGKTGTITRSKKHFRYPEGPGIGVFDHDPKPGQKPLTPDQLKVVIGRVCPPFCGVATLYTPSTSSCIYTQGGAEISGVSAGFHMYFPVKDASRLPEFSDILFKKLCIAGYGYAFITRAGSTILRTVFDKSVFGPERLDFVAGAVCENCRQQLPEPIFTDGGML